LVGGKRQALLNSGQGKKKSWAGTNGLISKLERDIHIQNADLAMGEGQRKLGCEKGNNPFLIEKCNLEYVRDDNREVAELLVFSTDNL
jgi:hypothetical protein